MTAGNDRGLDPWRHVLFRRVTRRLRNRIAAPAVQALHAPWIRRSAARGDLHAPIFIIGPPRTGSTILYQALTNYLDVLYIDNLVCRWSHAPYLGFALSVRRFGRQPHDNFVAEHGETESHGLHAPSECGGFWYRWLPGRQHFVDDHEITESMVNGLRLEVNAIQNRFGLPLLFKNLNVGQRLRLIHRAFPNARLILIRRDSRHTVDSIMTARRRSGAGPGEWWSTRPPGYENLLHLPERAMVEAQVATIETQIELDLHRFPREQWREIHYEQLGEGLVTDLAAWLELGLRPHGTLPEFRPNRPSG